MTDKLDRGGGAACVKRLLFMLLRSEPAERNPPYLGGSSSCSVQRQCSVQLFVSFPLFLADSVCSRSVTANVKKSPWVCGRGTWGKQGEQQLPVLEVAPVGCVSGSWTTTLYTAHSTHRV